MIKRRRHPFQCHYHSLWPATINRTAIQFAVRYSVCVWIKSHFMVENISFWLSVRSDTGYTDIFITKNIANWTTKCPLNNGSTVIRCDCRAHKTSAWGWATQYNTFGVCFVVVVFWFFLSHVFGLWWILCAVDCYFYSSNSLDRFNATKIKVERLFVLTKD